MEFGLLGPLLIRIDTRAVELGAPKQRALLIQLILRVGETVSVDRLIEALWEEDPSPQARATLRSYVSSLRRTLEAPGEAPIIVTRGGGYGLHADPGTVDVVRFERLAGTARASLSAGEPQSALDAVDEALGLWRGEALADVADRPFARAERIRLDQLRLSAQEDRFDALLALGRHGEAVASADAFTATEPLRERAQAQLMLGLYRSGRAADALQVFARFREALIDEVGLDPSPRLHGLAERILNQASDLDLPRSDLDAVTSIPAAGHGQPHGPIPVRTADPPSPLVGRAHERRELQAGVDRLVAGQGGLVLLDGEPGIGKTALLEELARLAVAGGVEVHWGRCHETSGAPPFWPWMQILRSIAGERTDVELEAMTSGSAAPVAHLVDAIAERLGQPRVVLGDDVESARFQLYDAIATFLTRASELRPMVLLLDDLHWADTPTLQALAFFTRHLSQSRSMVAGTYRDVRTDWTTEVEATLASVAREPATRQISLTGLQPVAIAELTEQMTGEPVTGEELELLHERTAGNPFFVRQLSHLHAEAERRPEAMSIPTGVRHVIARRLSMLPAEVRDLLDVAAVIGARFDLRQLAAAGMTPGETLEATGRAAAHRMLVAAGKPTGSYRFVHALVRETIYDGLPARRAAELHTRVGEVLEQMPDPPIAQLAEHFWRAADLVTDGRPVRYLVAAAADALEVMAYEQAETCLRRALELLTSRGDDPTEELRVRVQLVQLLVSVHGWGSDAVEEIAAPARKLARTAGLATGIAPLWAALLSTHIARGDPFVADEIARELLSQAIEADNPGALAAGHSAVAYVGLTLGRDLDVVLEHARCAEHYAGLALPEDLQAVPHLGAAAIYTQALVLAYQGEHAAAVATARRSIDLVMRVADPLSQAVVQMVSGMVGVVASQPTFVIEAVTAGRALCDRHGYRSVSSFMTVCDGWARAQLGGDAAVQADTMARAVEAIRKLGGADPMAKFLLYTAETYLLARDGKAAERCLAEARALAGRTGEFLPAQRFRQAEAQLAIRGVDASR